MLNGSVFPSSPSIILMQLAHELTLAPNRQVQSNSAIPMILSRLQKLHFFASDQFQKQLKLHRIFLKETCLSTICLLVMSLIH